jgi:ribosomal protein S18 acetylase RimI-like enzyme
MITIRTITESDYEVIRLLDHRSFEKESFRSLENIANLCSADPNGCFIGLADNIPVAYIFTRTFGSVGYLGPLGVDKKFQGQGWGKKIIQTGISYLSKHCTVIGLETYPVWGKNIGLYHRLGFRTTLSARMVTKSIQPDFYQKQRSPYLRLGTEINSSEFSTLVNFIRSWTNKVYPGLDFSRDIVHFISNYPHRILFYFNEDIPQGFLAFENTFNPFVWGAVRLFKSDQIILKELITGIEDMNWTSHINFHYQTSHTRLTDVFLDCGYYINQDVSCMLLINYEGQYTQPISSLVIRSWWG